MLARRVPADVWRDSPALRPSSRTIGPGHSWVIMGALRASTSLTRCTPQRPNAHVYEPLDSEELDVAFGIDLRKWAGEQGWKSMVHSGQQQNGEPTKGAIPEVLKAMLDGLQELSKDVPDDGTHGFCPTQGHRSDAVQSHRETQGLDLRSALDRDTQAARGDQ